jgi:hypothetical protein
MRTKSSGWSFALHLAEIAGLIDGREAPFHYVVELQ